MKKTKVTDAVVLSGLRAAVVGQLPGLEKLVDGWLDGIAELNEGQRASLKNWMCAVIQLKLEYYVCEREHSREGKAAAAAAISVELSRIKLACVGADKANTGWIPGALDMARKGTTVLARHVFTRAQDGAAEVIA